MTRLKDLNRLVADRYDFKIAEHPIGLYVLAIWSKHGFAHYRTYERTAHYRSRIRKTLSEYGCEIPSKIKWDALESHEFIERPKTEATCGTSS